VSEFVEVTQLKLARRVWSLNRAYPMKTAPRSVTSPSPSPLDRSQIEKRSSSPSSVALVASASRSVALSMRVLRSVESELHTSPRSALSDVFLQMRRTARRAKSQRNTERFVSIKSVLGYVPEFRSPQPVSPAGSGTSGDTSERHLRAVSRTPGRVDLGREPGLSHSVSSRHRLLKAREAGAF
jgi:hypothetical protein